VTYFVKLTRYKSTEEVFVNVAEIAEFSSKEGGTTIRMASDLNFSVTETAREIMKMIPSEHRFSEFGSS
jgi:hypothetical protein